MRCCDLYKSVLTDIASRLFAEGKMTETEKNDILEELDLENTPKANRNWFEGISDLGIYENFIEEINELEDEAATEEISSWHVAYAMADASDEAEIQSFVLNDIRSQICVITAKKLYSYANGTRSDNIGVGPVVNKIWSSAIGSQADMDQFWQLCTIENSRGYYVISQRPILNERQWDMYAYAYLSHLNSNHFAVHSVLSFNKDQQFSSALSYDNQTIYSQYFDIYHVLGESKFCSDVLSRFLRVYQVIEDMCYRKQIAEIANNQLRRKGFVRHVMKVSSKDMGNEENTIKKAVAALFPNIHTRITDLVLTPYNRFLQEHYIISSGEPHSAAKIGKIIYQLRNSIVHNKHTEFHFSYGNVEEYSVIIPLLRKLIETLEPMIIEIINNHSQTIIDYQSKTIQVY